MLDVYGAAIKEHVAECAEDLAELAAILTTRELTRIEQKAAERLLQVLVEACIGVAKQWLKSKHKVVPSDAYDAFEKIASLKKLNSDDAQNWRKVIGMRNAIVHDYLNLDARLLASVIKTKKYLSLLEFIEQFVNDFGQSFRG